MESHPSIQHEIERPRLLVGYTCGDGCSPDQLHHCLLRHVHAGVDECDHLVVAAMVTWSDTVDENRISIPSEGSSPIPAPNVPITDNDILLSRSRKTVSLLRVPVGSSSSIERESFKEVIDPLFFRVDQQQEILTRNGHMEAALALPIARNRQLNK